MILFTLSLSVFAQEKPKPAEHPLAKEELAQVQQFGEMQAKIQEEYQAIFLELAKPLLSREQKAAIVDRWQLLLRDDRDIKAAISGFINELKKKYDCATCEIKDGKFIAAPAKPAK